LLHFTDNYRLLHVTVPKMQTKFYSNVKVQEKYVKECFRPNRWF